MNEKLKIRHIPVLLEEVLDGLDLEPGDYVIDGTFGGGGHALAIAERTAPAGKLLGIDRDPKTVVRAHELIRAHELQNRITLWQGNFSNITQAIHDTSFPQPNGIILDLGISSDQLADPAYGLSFQTDAPLDMRLDPSGEMRASDIILTWSEEELVKLFREYGEEPRARLFAHAVVEKRRSISRSSDSGPRLTTRELARWIETAVGHHQRGRPGHQRIHPATRIFQALRIAVNQELDHLRTGLETARGALASGGRLLVISFHSLEDRIVKETFRAWAAASYGQLLSKRAIRPSAEEIESNPRSRSAKLRGFIKK